MAFWAIVVGNPSSLQPGKIRCQDHLALVGAHGRLHQVGHLAQSRVQVDDYVQPLTHFAQQSGIWVEQLRRWLFAGSQAAWVGLGRGVVGRGSPARQAG